MKIDYAVVTERANGETRFKNFGTDEKKAWKAFKIALFNKSYEHVYLLKMKNHRFIGWYRNMPTGRKVK